LQGEKSAPARTTKTGFVPGRRLCDSQSKAYIEDSEVSNPGMNFMNLYFGRKVLDKFYPTVIEQTIVEIYNCRFYSVLSNIILHNSLGLRSIKY
jgi:hypothetical protein